MSAEPQMHYVVNVHRNPAQVTRLLTTLRTQSPAAHLHVRWDCAGERPDLDALRALDVSVQPTATPLPWGGPQLLLSVLDSLRQIQPAPHDWVMTLSGQDYPVQPLATLERFLVGSDADALLDQSYLTNPSTPYLLARYRARCFRLPGTRGTWVRRWVERLVERMPGMRLEANVAGLPLPLAVRRLSTPFSDTFHNAMGRDYYALRGTSVAVLLAAARTPLLRYYKRTFAAGEGFVHVVLLNDPHLQVLADPPQHFARFRPGIPHPDTLVTGDLPEVLSSGAFFARKFKPGDPVLDQLDALLAQSMTSEPAPPDPLRRFLT